MLPSNCHLQKKEGQDTSKGSEAALNPLFLLTLTGHQLESKKVGPCPCLESLGKNVGKMETGQLDPKPKSRDSEVNVFLIGSSSTLER